jgi:hypothetical protein
VRAEVLILLLEAMEGDERARVCAVVTRETAGAGDTAMFFEEALVTVMVGVVALDAAAE